MSFTSTNEIEQFSFEDCVITKFEIRPNSIILTLESLIVLPRNSQNSNYTESYADTTTLEFLHCSLTEAVKEGYRYYDANDVLTEEVEDEPVLPEQYESLASMFVDAYLYEVSKESSDEESTQYLCAIELCGEDAYDKNNLPSYRLLIKAKDCVLRWERYLNRVQR